MFLQHDFFLSVHIIHSLITNCTNLSGTEVKLTCLISQISLLKKLVSHGVSSSLLHWVWFEWSVTTLRTLGGVPGVSYYKKDPRIVVFKLFQTMGTSLLKTKTKILGYPFKRDGASECQLISTAISAIP